MVLFRLLQGVFGAALVPLSQAVMLDSYALHERRQGDVDLGHGRDAGPDHGTGRSGAWLTEAYTWHCVFFVNLPVGILTVLGLTPFMDETAKSRAALRLVRLRRAALAIGAMQVALDRGEELDWFGSGEIVVELIVAGSALYFFLVHSFTTAEALHAALRSSTTATSSAAACSLRHRPPPITLDHGAAAALSFKPHE